MDSDHCLSTYVQSHTLMSVRVLFHFGAAVKMSVKSPVSVSYD